MFLGGIINGLQIQIRAFGRAYVKYEYITRKWNFIIPRSSPRFSVLTFNIGGSWVRVRETSVMIRRSFSNIAV